MTAEAVVKTKHPYVIRVKGVCGGRPIIEDTRIPVWAIAGWLRQGKTPEEIQREVYPHLSLAQIYDAISFYYENRDEIDPDLAYNNPPEDELSERAKQWRKLSS